MMDNKPLVFLDVDGVLNNPETWGKHVPNMVDALDEDKVRLLDTLVETVDAEIVISSSWRYQATFEEMRALLGPKGLSHPERIVGQTAKGGMDHRGVEIADWLLGAFDVPDLFPPFIILDDMGLEEFEGLGTHLLQTDWSIGLTVRDVDQAFRLFHRQGLWWGTLLS